MATISTNVPISHQPCRFVELKHFRPEAEDVVYKFLLRHI